MGIVISPSSEYGRELWKWDHTIRETHPDDDDKPEHLRLHGVRPVTFQEYPKMLYKAQKKNGKYMIGLPIPNANHYDNPIEYERACLAQEAFNRSCQFIVRDASEEKKALDSGWAKTSDEALLKAESWEREIGNAAAEAAHQARRMSEKAQREFAEAEAQTSEHVTDVVPKRKRGRPAKGVEAVTASKVQS